MSHQGRLLSAPIAHRGLWRVGGPPENSLAAFDAACAGGYGIELDVRLSADGEAIVFHDDALERLTAESGLTEERTAQELGELRLLGSDQTIPTLEQALNTIAGRSLVLVELKTLPGQESPLEARVAAMLAAYTGPCGVLSFNAEALNAVAAHAPGLIRGLNVGTEEELAEIDGARPHFLSISIDLSDHPRVEDWRGAGRTAIAWTVRKSADWERLSALVDNLIFEGFAP